MQKSRWPVAQVALLLVYPIAFWPTSAFGDPGHDALRKMVREDIVTRRVPYVEPDFGAKSGYYYYNLDYVNEKFLTGIHAIDAQYLVEVIRATFKKPHQQKWWNPVLAEVEAVIAEELAYRSQEENPNPQKIAKFKQRIDALYVNHLRGYASSVGLQLKYLERPDLLEKLYGSLPKAALPLQVKLISSSNVTGIDWIRANKVRFARLNPAFRKVEYRRYRPGETIRVFAGAQYYYRLERNGQLSAERLKQIDGRTSEVRLY